MRTFPSATYRDLAVLDIHIDEGIPHVVKYLVDVRLELEGTDVEQPDGATRPAHRDLVQLRPGF
jgi:hypothetical protein